MQIFEKKKALNHCLSILKLENKQIGFVPTMGALHKGHLSLLEESQKNNAISVVSIFVNPTQFNNQEDLKKYPKTLEKDLELLAKSNCDIVFIPSVEEIYADKVLSKSYSFDGIEHQMEGKFRAGHFDGVATIVHAFFDIIKPNNAYFGQKDFQQLQIVKKLAKKEHLDIAVIGCPIFREEDGLAMSSRNARLSSSQRQNVPLIYQTLQKAAQLITINSISEIQLFVRNVFNQHNTIDLEYFTIAEEESLQEATTVDNHKKYRAFIAVHVGSIRLIDNISLPITK